MLGPWSNRFVQKRQKKVGPHNASEAVRPRSCRNGVTLQPVKPLRLIWPDCGRQKLKSKKLFDPSSCVCSEQKSNRRTQHNAYPCNPITHVRGRQPSSFAGFYLRQQGGDATCSTKLTGNCALSVTGCRTSRHLKSRHVSTNAPVVALRFG